MPYGIPLPAKARSLRRGARPNAPPSNGLNLRRVALADAPLAFGLQIPDLLIGQLPADELATQPLLKVVGQGGSVPTYAQSSGLSVGISRTGAACGPEGWQKFKVN